MTTTRSAPENAADRARVTRHSCPRAGSPAHTVGDDRQTQFRYYLAGDGVGAVGPDVTAQHQDRPFGLGQGAVRSGATASSSTLGRSSWAPVGADALPWRKSTSIGMSAKRDRGGLAQPEGPVQFRAAWAGSVMVNAAW